MKTLSPRYLSPLYCALFLACEDPAAPTYTIVTIDAVEELREAALNLRVKSPRVNETFPYSSPVAWPETLKLVPSSDTNSRYEVTAEALAPSGDVLATAALRSGYVAHETRYLRVLLETGCTGSQVQEIAARDLPRERDATRADVRSCSESSESSELMEDNQPDPRERMQAGASVPPQAGSSAESDCPLGHRRDAEGDCVVVDECEESSPCGEHGSCVEQSDGYSCNCAGGYVFENGTCTDKNECSDNKGGCEHDCQNELGTFHCECGDSGILRSDGRSCWRWTQALPVDSGNTGDATEPHVGVGADGEAVVLWRQANGTDDLHMRANRYRGGSWQTAERIGGAGSDALLLVQPDASATALWRDGNAIQVNTASAMAWGSQIDAARSDNENYEIWSFAADSNAAGQGWLLYWTQQIGRGGGGSIASKAWPLAANGGSPAGTVQPSSSAAPSVAHIDVALDEGGNSLVALLQAGLVVATYFDRDAGSWGEALEISDRTQDGVQPPRAAIVQHEVHTSGPPTYYSQTAVVWGRDSETESGVWARWGTSGSWNPAIKLGDVAPASGTLHVGMTGGDHVLAVWQGMDFAVWLAEFDAVSSGVGDIQGARVIDAASSVQTTDPALAVLPDGRAIIVWVRDDGEHKHVWAKHFTPDKGWGPELRLSRSDAQAASEPAVALAANGNAIAVWQEADESRHHIVASTFE